MKHTQKQQQRALPRKVHYYTAEVSLPSMTRPMLLTINAFDRRDAARQLRSLREHMTVRLQS